eukprot:TRINITY_DN60277_c0_g1_i1.p2 TRINITY_DN60277_c0_g1~~TRINITY_DN60277_c0_g1_i1.p2  ORF type:complete len:110 (-),score=1.06 TRINITY_DN60277_c0_g1_i1:65-394(-)
MLPVMVLDARLLGLWVMPFAARLQRVTMLNIRCALDLRIHIASKVTGSMVFFASVFGGPGQGHDCQQDDEIAAEHDANDSSSSQWETRTAQRGANAERRRYNLTNQQRF